MAKFSRREFIKITSAGALMTALPLHLGVNSFVTAIGKVKKSVALAPIKRGSSEEEIINAVRATAEYATDFSWLARGDSVLIKPVCNSGNKYPATTSPLAISAMIRLLKDKGAGQVYVMDMSGIEYVKLTEKGLVKGSTRKLMENNGILQATLKEGGILYLPEEEGWSAFYEETPKAKRSWKRGISIPKILQKVDHIVLMPRTGRHVLTGSSLGLKAVVGYMRLDSRLEFHRDASTFHAKIAEANTLPTLLNKQRLVLTLADKVLSTFGPDEGYVATPEVGLVMASESVLAHDMVSLAWLLECLRNTPEEERDSVRKDPCLSPTAVNVTNRGVVMLLGGAVESAKTEKMPWRKVTSIWDDLVLQNAFEVFGFVPQVNFYIVSFMSDTLLEMLQKSVALPN